VEAREFQYQRQPGLHRETLSAKQKLKLKKKKNSNNKKDLLKHIYVTYIANSK
jgi:hypothetical protein